MPHFAIWLPDPTHAYTDDSNRLAEALCAVGLSDLASEFDFRQRALHEQSGWQFVWRRPNQPPPNLAQATWIPAIAQPGLEAARYSVGITTAAPPDLMRNHTFPGRHVVLGDGQVWLIPVLERLPVTLFLQDDGRLAFEPVRIYNRQVVDMEYRRLVTDWQRIIRESGEQTEMEWTDLYQFAVRTLQINYRITHEVVAHLALLNTENLTEILLTAVGGYDQRNLRGLKGTSA